MIQNPYIEHAVKITYIVVRVPKKDTFEDESFSKLQKDDARFEVISALNSWYYS